MEDQRRAIELAFFGDMTHHEVDPQPTSSRKVRAVKFASSGRFD
jgi:hypothetical protein